MGWLEDRKSKEMVEKILFGGFKPQQNQAGAYKADAGTQKKGLKPYEQVAFNQTFSFNPNSQTAST